MKKLLPQKLNVSELSSLLTEAKKQVTRLVPSSATSHAVQLPIPLTPFDQYRRKKLVKMLNLRGLATGQSVLEVGCGIGDVLLEVSKYKPKELYGIDSSEEMISIARQFLEGVSVDLWVTKSRRLPFPEKSFDVVILMFELQYITNKDDLDKIIYETCRVARKWVVLVEDTAPAQEMKSDHICRTVEAYRDEFRKKKFHLRKTTYLDESASRFVFTGDVNPWHWIRWVFSPVLYLMGFPREWMKLPTGRMDQPDSKFAILLQKLTLPLVSGLDELFKPGKGITAMRFEREQLFRRG